MRKHALVLGLLAAVALPTAADGFYAFGDVGQSKFTGDFDETDTNLAIGLGYALNSTFSVELGYHDLGGVKVNYTEYSPIAGDIDIKGSADATAVNLSAIAKLPLSDSFGIYGRLGYAHMKVDVKATASAMGHSYTENDSNSENKPIYGVGADYKLNEKVSLRADYIKYSDEDISSFTVGATYAF